MARIRARVITRNISLVSYTDIVRTNPSDHQIITLPRRAVLAGNLLGFAVPTGDPVAIPQPGWIPIANANGNAVFANTPMDVAALNVGTSITDIFIPYPQCTMRFSKVGSMPSHPGRIHSADGHWFEARDGITPEFFGAVGDGTTDNTLAFSYLGECLTGIGGGCKVTFGKGLSYEIYTTLPILTTTPQMMILDGVHGVVVDFNGSTWNSPLIMTSAEGNCLRIIGGSSYVTVKGYRCLCATLTVTETTTNGGFYYGFFAHVEVSGGCHHISVSGYAQGGLNGFYSVRQVSATLDHCHHLYLDITCLDTFYPVSHQGGAYLCNSRIDATNVGRAYFPNNTQDFYVELKLRGMQVISPCIDVTCVYDSIDPSAYVANGYIEVDASFNPVGGALCGVVTLPGNNGARGYAAPEMSRIENVTFNIDGARVDNINGLFVCDGFRARSSDGSQLGYQLGEPESGHYIKGLRITGHAYPDWSHTFGSDCFVMFTASTGFGPNSLVDVIFDGFKAPSAGSFGGTLMRIGPYANVAINDCDFRNGNLAWQDPLYVGMSGASGTFAAGETITGGASGATGLTISDSRLYAGTAMAYYTIDGKLILFSPSSTPFQVGETITGGTSGMTATVTSLAIGYNGTPRENTSVKDSWINSKFCSSPTGAGSHLHSTAIPSTPQNGDVWVEGSALKVRLNGVTKTVTVS